MWYLKIALYSITFLFTVATIAIQVPVLLKVFHGYRPHVFTIHWWIILVGVLLARALEFQDISGIQ